MENNPYDSPFENPFAANLAELEERGKGTKPPCCQNPACQRLLLVSEGQVAKYCSKPCKKICKQIESAGRKLARKESRNATQA